MRTIIAGSRAITDFAIVKKAIESSGFSNEISVVVSGGAIGVDRLGERWAKENGIPVTLYPADWKKEGKKAGYLRNITMSKNADACICIWDGNSKGTEHMMNQATLRGLDLYVFNVQLNSK